jgi:SOS-response transcriptional repressor LexA
MKGPELLQEIKSQRREKTATSSIRTGHAELRARSTTLRPRHLDQLEEKRTILEESEEGEDDELRAEETATGGARDHEHKEPNVTSMEPGAPINEGYQYNEHGDSLPNRARTLMEELENTQTKITGREDPETEDESQVGVPEETKQEDHRGTEEATGYGQTT